MNDEILKNRSSFIVLKVHRSKIMQSFSANGKLLITAEYFVIDGAKALAIPVKFGQGLQIVINKIIPELVWRSFDNEKNLWFNAIFNAENFRILQSSDSMVAETLSKILSEAQKLRQISDFGFRISDFGKSESEKRNPLILSHKVIETHLNFPRLWGLGTSSTLIYLIAELFEVNPYLLSKATLGGSGYDIACAGAQSAIIYQISATESAPIVTPVVWQPTFSEQLFFIYSGRKQNSREGIAHYRATAEKNKILIDTATQLTADFLSAATLSDFEKLITEHEKLVRSATHLQRVKNAYFSDYWGEIKSLGAWGGDFVLATSDRTLSETKNYFSQKGCKTFFSFTEITDF